MKGVLDEDIAKAVDAAVALRRNERGALLPLLHELQDALGGFTPFRC